MITEIFQHRHEKACFLHICKNKGADQLCGNCAADQCLCFCYIESTLFINAIFSGCTAWFVLDLYRNPDRFCHDTVQIPFSSWENTYNLDPLPPNFHIVILGLQMSIFFHISASKQTLSAEEIRCVFDDN